MSDVTKEILLNINVNTAQVETELANVKKQIGDVGNVRTDSFKSLKQELKEANVEAQNIGRQFGLNSKEFTAAAQKVANLKDQFEDTNKVIKNFNPDNKLQGLVGVASGAASAIQGIAGAFTLVGVNADTANVAIAKLQGIMALTDSISQIDNIKNSFTALSSTIRGSVVKAFTTLRGALSALGIGLLTTAIAFLVENFDEIKETVEDLFPGLGNLGSAFDRFKQIVTGVGAVVVKTLILPLQKVIETIKQIKNFFTDGEFDFGKIAQAGNFNPADTFNGQVAKTAQKQRDEANKEALDKDIKAREQRLNVLKAEGKSTIVEERKILNDKIKLYKEGTEEYNKAVNDRDVFEAGVRKEQAAKDKAAYDKRLEQQKEYFEKLKQQEEEYQTFLKSIKDQYFSSVTTDLQKELDAVEKKYEKELEYARKFNKDVAFLEEAKEAEIQQIREKNRLENNVTRASSNTTVAETALQQLPETDTFGRTRATQDLFQARREEAKAQYEQDLIDAGNNLEKKYQLEVEYSNKLVQLKQQEKDQIDAIEKTAEEKRSTSVDNAMANGLANINTMVEANKNASKEIVFTAEEERDARIGAYAAVGDALGALGDLFGQQTVANKALNVANAIMNTALGITQIWANKTVIPEPFGTIQKVAATVTAAASGFAAVKQILSTKVPGGGGGGSAPSLSSLTPPTIQPVLANNTPQNVRVVGGGSVVRAYVVDTDLRTAQEKNSFLNRLSGF